MISKKCAAGMAALVTFGIGATIAPVETSARSGGFGAAPSMSAHGSVRSSFASPHSALAHMRDFRTRLGDRRGERTGFPLWWSGDYLPSYPYGYADLSGEVPYAYPPMENFSERSRPIVTHPPACRTDTQTVPSESGGERTINITRCY
jgi:hypothetical protein